VNADRVYPQWLIWEALASKIEKLVQVLPDVKGATIEQYLVVVRWFAPSV